jgi:DnaJ-class molecular chaperone
MKDKQMGVTVSFTPERYGMIFCPICSGKGYLERSNGDREVCRMCRGFGLIRKENFGIQQPQK